MAINNPYATYANNKVLTATPAELTLMLYEGAIKFTNIAIVAIEKNDIQKSHTNIMKAERIIIELQASLDSKYPISEDFNKVYTYLIRKFRDANIKKDKAILEEILPHLRTMRDTWKQVMVLSKK